MANEILYTLIINATKNGAKLATISTTGTAGTKSMAGNDSESGTQLITTSAGAVTIGSVAIAGALIYFKNLDPTNFVVLSMASDATNPFATLKPGDEHFSRGPATGTIYAKADTASVRILKQILSA